MIDFEAHERQMDVKLAFMMRVDDVCNSLRHIRQLGQAGLGKETYEKYKVLFFLLDSAEPHKWFEKALKEVPIQEHNLLDYALKAKMHFKEKYKK